MEINLGGWIAVHFLNGSKNLNKKQEPLKKYVDLFGPFFPFSDKMTQQVFDKNNSLDKIAFSLVKKTSNIINDYPEKDTHIK